jgi:hypothetical protein
MGSIQAQPLWVGVDVAALQRVTRIPEQYPEQPLEAAPGNARFADGPTRTMMSRRRDGPYHPDR